MGGESSAEDLLKLAVPRCVELLAADYLRLIQGMLMFWPSSPVRSLSPSTDPQVQSDQWKEWLEYFIEYETTALRVPPKEARPEVNQKVAALPPMDQRSDVRVENEVLAIGWKLLRLAENAWKQLHESDPALAARWMKTASSTLARKVSEYEVGMLMLAVLQCRRATPGRQPESDRP